MSITAFPVLARILTERNLHRTRVGAVTITCAAVDDVTAWCMLAFVVAVAKANGIGPGIITAGMAAAYVLVMYFIVRPFLNRLQLFYDRTGRLGQGMVAIILLLVMASAFTTEMIGIHALFGAFLMGAIMPKGSRFVRDLTEKLEDFTVVFLLPIFFAFTGLKTQIGLLNSFELWMYTLLIIAVACAGKFGGSAIAARLSGFTWRESSAIGILMNTRGLMELLILNIGRELGVITDAVFAMMVIMALATTAMTTPILHWVYPRKLFGESEGEPRIKSAFSVLIPIAAPRSGASLLDLANSIGGADPTRVIYAAHLTRPVDRDAYRVGIDPEPQAQEHEPLQPLLAQAAKLKVPVEPISFVSRDVPGDIARLAEHRKVDLLLMGFHHAVFSANVLGGTVHRVLSSVETNVAIFVDRGYRGAKKILVPYLGSTHDILAMEIARRLATAPDVEVTVLHVVPRARSTGSSVAGQMERLFSEPGVTQQVRFKVVQDDSPVDVVVRHAQEADLTVIGVAEEWGLESHLFGFRSERIAQEVESSLLIVRRHKALPVPMTATPKLEAAPA
jgi:Kef-type K+ transport system membrane component KefB